MQIDFPVLKTEVNSCLKYLLTYSVEKLQLANFIIENFCHLKYCIENIYC